MPFRTLMSYRNPDITSDLNHRLRDLVQKGVFFGGDVIPVAGQLNVSVGNVGVVGADGMVTLLEGVPETIGVQAGFAQWVLLRAVYVANDDSIAALEVLTETAYDALSDAEKDERIKLAKVTLGPTAAEVTTADISFVEAEQIDPVERSSFRGNVEQETDLPDWTDPATGVTTQNRPNDIYFVENQRIFYSWNVAGTPQWARITAEEVVLNLHKDNQDDGTVAPDLFNAVHVQVKHRESLDEGSASVKQHGSDGTDFGTGNAFVDEALPVTVLHREDVTGLATATQFQLTGTYYVGKGAVGTASPHLQLAQYQQASSLLGSDRNPITIFQVRCSDDLSELDPSADADALGYYAQPIVVMNFSATTDSDITGSLSCYGRLERGAGTVAPGDESLDSVGLGFIRPAEDIPVVSSGFATLPGAIDDVQQALDEIDSIITPIDQAFSVGPTPGDLVMQGSLYPSGSGNVLGSRNTSWDEIHGEQAVFSHDGTAPPVILPSMHGVELSSKNMDTTNKYTSALKFMSTDPAFTTDNPKLLGCIVGRATEAYDADTDGGIAIDFFTSPNNPGASSAPELAMTIDNLKRLTVYQGFVVDTGSTILKGAVAIDEGTPSSTTSVKLLRTQDAASDEYGVIVEQEIGGAAPAGTKMGHSVLTDMDLTSGTLTKSRGYFANASIDVDSPGALTEHNQYDSYAYLSGTNTISNFNHYMVEQGVVFAGHTVGYLTGYRYQPPTIAGTVNYQYGMWIGNVTGASNNYGLYINGATDYAIWVDSGDCRLDGDLNVYGTLTLELGANPNVAFINSSNTGTPSVAAGWIEVTIGGATRWIQTYSTSP